MNLFEIKKSRTREPIELAAVSLAADIASDLATLFAQGMDDHGSRPELSDWLTPGAGYC